MSMYNLIEYSSNYSGTAGSLWFYSKDEATNFNADIENNNAFKSFEYKTKLVGETKAQPTLDNNSGILKNATIAMPLKYLSNFYRSLEISLINCKVELKLKWTRQCVLAAAVDNVNANDDNINFIIRDRKLYVLVIILSAKGNQNYQNFLVKGLEDRCVGINIKNVRLKTQQMSIDNFSNHTL